MGRVAGGVQLGRRRRLSRAALGSESGDIYPEVAEYWRENYDLSHILRWDWSTLGPKVLGKLHFAVGMMDNYYLNEAVYLVQEFLDSATDPPSDATFQYGGLRAHVRIVR